MGGAHRHGRPAGVHAGAVRPPAVGALLVGDDRACRRASCSRTAGSSSSTSRRSRCTTTSVPATGSCGSPPPGWMMWNFLVGGLLVGATVVLYDGSPGHPDLDVLWGVVERHRSGRVRHVGALPAVVPEGGARAGRAARPVRRAHAGLHRLAAGARAVRVDRRVGRRARADLARCPAARTSAPRSSPARRRCRCGWASCRARRWAPTSTPSTRRAPTSRSATTRPTWASW